MILSEVVISSFSRVIQSHKIAKVSLIVKFSRLATITTTIITTITITIMSSELPWQMMEEVITHMLLERIQVGVIT